jgi:hypothetical protein
MRSPENPPEDRAMVKTSRPARPQPQEPENALAQDIRDQATEIADEVAALLADIPDEQLFGNTELLIRDKVLKLVAQALAAKLDQKKTATTAPASTAASAEKPLDSTAIESEIP